MIPLYRDQYNADFSEKKYHKFLLDLDQEAGYHIDFRIAETPLFIPADLLTKILDAGNKILSVVTAQNYSEWSRKAIPNECFVPNESKLPSTVALDFAVCRNENGEFIPQLIELQAFPSLFSYQHWLAKKYREHFTIPESMRHLFANRNEASYIELLRKWIVADHDPDHVVLLEIEPEKQKTRVDFELTKKYAGINYLCITKVIVEGRKLYYKRNGKKIPIKRIYNRVIFDELLRRTDLQCQFHLTEDVDVEWVSHPNWFFRISKFSLPFLHSHYVPKTYFLDQLQNVPVDLENYVLKPLFSFAGAGVTFDVTAAKLKSITDPHHYILQRKVNYEPVLRSPHGMVKTEIRILFLPSATSEKLEPVISLVRLSRGKMIGVDFNKNKTWVGGSVGFFEI